MASGFEMYTLMAGALMVWNTSRSAALASRGLADPPWVVVKSAMCALQDSTLAPQAPCPVTLPFFRSSRQRQRSVMDCAAPRVNVPGSTVTPFASRMVAPFVSVSVGIFQSGPSIGASHLHWPN